MGVVETGVVIHQPQASPFALAGVGLVRAEAARACPAPTDIGAVARVGEHVPLAAGHQAGGSQLVSRQVLLGIAIRFQGDNLAPEGVAGAFLGGD